MTQTDQTIWLTQTAYDKLHAELEDLKGPQRAEIIARISAARDEGDLMENGGYHAARDEQGRIKGRIDQLKDMLRRAEVGETPPDDGVVEPGMAVTVEREGLTVSTPRSPLGEPMNGQKRGETVTYEVNGKPQTVIILDATPYTA